MKLSINQNQHLLKFMRILSSLYSEDVQFADCLNVHPPKKKKKKVFSCPSSSSSTTFGKLPPHKSQFFYQFQDVHPFLYKAQTMNEEVLWVKVYAASNGCTHGQGHGENLSLSSTHVRI
ncbi:hypothetical protein, partial [Thiolapillus sp.]|uniref:hypothetical protein n=1 Tax=Thiolapillus sp. TaxID=2017437 RepID=UPI003AF6EA76